jgi:hypothetical protein
MTRDEIIRMAQEANVWVVGQEPYQTQLERFAALVAAAAVRETSAEYRLGWNDGAMMEREACARVCEEFDFEYQDDSAGSLEGASAAIRARGQG